MDESLISIIKEQEEVFNSSYPNSEINLVPTSEILAVNSLIKGEADFAILTRTLTEEENIGFKQRSITPRVFPAASEGLVLVVAENGKDSTIRMEDILELLQGEKAAGYNGLIFADINSSAFRQLKELSGLQKISGAYVKEVGNNENLMKTVIKEVGMIGVLGYDEYRTLKKTFSEINKIRILSVQNSIGKNADNKFYQPTQSNFALGTYPLARTIYVLNYQPRRGVGIGWSAFLTGDRGQRIFLKAGLLPNTMPGREIIIRDKVN